MEHGLHPLQRGGEGRGVSDVGQHELCSRIHRLAVAGGEIVEEGPHRELLDAQGDPVDLGGYFHPDPAKCAAAMRPSATFNSIIDGMA